MHSVAVPAVWKRCVKRDGDQERVRIDCLMQTFSLTSVYACALVEHMVQPVVYLLYTRTLLGVVSRCGEDGVPGVAWEGFCIVTRNGPPSWCGLQGVLKSSCNIVD